MHTKQQVMDILASHGIKMNVTRCGCCGRPTVSFEYNGDLILDDEYYYCFQMIPGDYLFAEDDIWDKMEDE